MFKLLGAPTISSSGARIHLSKMYSERSLDLIKHFKEKNIFVVIDESEVNKNKYCIILAGDIEESHKIFLLDCVKLDKNMNSEIVKKIILDTLVKYGIPFEKLRLVISDAARYMT